MKKCKACRSEIDDKATKCPKCQADQRNWFARHKIMSVLLALIALGVVTSASKGGSTSSTPAAPDKSTSSSTSSSKLSTPTPAPQVLLDLSGSGTKTTQKFTAAGDWDLTWSYDCSTFGGQGNFMADVMQGDGSLSTANQGVNQLGASGSDVEHYHQGGTFYLEINSECKWHVTAKG